MQQPQKIAIDPHDQTIEIKLANGDFYRVSFGRDVDELEIMSVSMSIAARLAVVPVASNVMSLRLIEGAK